METSKVDTVSTNDRNAVLSTGLTNALAQALSHWSEGRISEVFGDSGILAISEPGGQLVLVVEINPASEPKFTAGRGGKTVDEIAEEITQQNVDKLLGLAVGASFTVQTTIELNLIKRPGTIDPDGQHDPQVMTVSLTAIIELRKLPFI